MSVTTATRLPEVRKRLAEIPQKAPMRIVAAGATDIGRRRQHNEDAVLLRPDLDLFIIADGAGGHNAGNIASALATTTIAKRLETTIAKTEKESPQTAIDRRPRLLASSIQFANREVVEAAKNTNRYRGMGSTVVCALVCQESRVVHIAHVGDSRAYRLRGGHLEALTLDHSLVNEVLETTPEVEDDVLARLPRNVITRALGMGEQLRVSVRSFELAEGDKYLLCTDGLTSACVESLIRTIMLQPLSPQQLVDDLIEAANAAGGPDNIGALILNCERIPSLSVALPNGRKDGLPPMRGTFGSAPEINIVGVATHLVPLDASGHMLEAIGDLALKFRDPSAEMEPTERICTMCGRSLKPAETCGH